MSVAAKHREVGVGQGAAGPVEGVAVPVLPLLEPHVDVDGAGAPLLEAQLGHVGPDSECSVNLSVDLSSGRIVIIMATELRKLAL